VHENAAARIERRLLERTYQPTFSWSQKSAGGQAGLTSSEQMLSQPPYGAAMASADGPVRNTIATSAERMKVLMMISGYWGPSDRH